MPNLRTNFRGCMNEDLFKFTRLLDDLECVCCVGLYRDFCRRVYVVGTCVIIVQRLWTSERVN
jgi:hypothetical protein